MKTNTIMNQSFVELLLINTGIEPRKAKAKTLAQLIIALEKEFQIYPDGFGKHFGIHSIDQRKLDGKCWEEILNISRVTFNNWFDKIGKTFKSEEEFKCRKDDKNITDKYFYYRVVTSNRRKVYYRNHSLLDSIIKSIQSPLKSEDSENQDLGIAG